MTALLVLLLAGPVINAVISAAAAAAVAAAVEVPLLMVLRPFAS